MEAVDWKTLRGQICHWVVKNIGDVIGRPYSADLSDGRGDQLIGIDDPRILRTINVQASDPTPPNAVRLGPTTGMIFVPLVSRMKVMYFGGDQNLCAFGVVEDNTIISAYVAATTGLVMAKGIDDSSEPRGLNARTQKA